MIKLEAVLWADGTDDDRPARQKIVLTCPDHGRICAFPATADLADVEDEARVHERLQHG